MPYPHPHPFSDTSASYRMEVEKGRDASWGPLRLRIAFSSRHLCLRSSNSLRKKEGNWWGHRGPEPPASFL